MPVRRPLALLAAVVAAVATAITAVVLAAPATAAVNPSTLNAPGVLHGGQQLVSQNANFRMLMGRNGDLLLYSPWHEVMWHSRTAGHHGAYLSLQSNGNLVVRAQSGKALWATKTRGRHARLVMRDNGSLALISGRRVLWYTHTVLRYGWHDNPAPRARLAPGHSLTPGHQLTSANGDYQALMRRSGGFVVRSSTATLWTTNTYGWSGARLTFAPDGNLVLYAADGRALWQSRTRVRGGLVVLADNGNLVIFDARGHIAWQSRTAPEPRVGPVASTSHYIRSTADLTATGCADATANGARRSVVVLDIGAQRTDVGTSADQWGVWLSLVNTHVTDAQLVPLLQSYVTGYGNCMAATGKLLLAVATNNDSRQYFTSGSTCPTPPSGSPDPLGAAGGAEWAHVITQLATAAAGHPGITVAGANDIEPGFAGCVSQASAWISALLAGTSGPYVFIGSADGCPAALGSAKACLAGWTQTQIHDLAYGLSPSRSIPLPQVYTLGMAAQWANISRNGGAPINFGGVLTEVAACASAGGCVSLSSPSAWNDLSNRLSITTGQRASAGPYTTDLRVN